MSENHWKVGDVVRLKSGGPSMVVTRPVGGVSPGNSWPDREVLCEWNVSGYRCANFYSPEVLELGGVDALPQSQIDVQATADACRGSLQDALGIRVPTSWSDLLYVVRSRTEEHRTDRVEADQTLITAQTEIAKLTADLATERKVHAENYKLLAKSNADHNKLVVKVAELEKNLTASTEYAADLRDAPRDRYYDEIRTAVGVAGRETILEAAKRLRDDHSKNQNHVSKLERELASERVLLSEANAKLAAIEAKSVESLRDVGASIANHINETVEAKDIAQAREILGAKPGEMVKAVADLQGKLKNANAAWSLADRDAVAALRRLGAIPCLNLTETADRLAAILGCGRLESVREAAERVTRDLKDRIAERDRYSSLLEKVRLAVNLTGTNAEQFLIQTIELHYKQSTIARMAASLLGCGDVMKLCKFVEELQNQQAESLCIMLTIRRILEAKDEESLNQAATRLLSSLTEESNRRTAAEGRLAAIKRALGNDGLLA